MTIPKGTYPNTFYRVSIKAIIHNDRGEVLLVKEKGSSWSLPGGGMDHGESLEAGLAREMYEEALIEQPFIATLRNVDSIYLPEKTAWLMWIVCELTFSEELTFGLGEDTDEIAFIDPATLKGSRHRSEQLVYKWCVDKSATIS